eukprot:435596-Amphidinium_carterae.1
MTSKGFGWLGCGPTSGFCAAPCDEERRAIVVELCDFNLEWLRVKVALDVSEQVSLMRQIAVGCVWIVHQRAIHGNLTMQNILIAKTPDAQIAEGKARYVAKVADCGLALRGSSTGADADPKAGHRAPETQSGAHSEKSDVYSFGHILH